MLALHQVHDRLEHWIWDPLPADCSWWRRQGVAIARLAVTVGHDVGTGALTMRAMSLVFTTLLSFVPLIAVSFSVLKGFGVHNRIEPTLLSLLAPLGERANEITARIVGFVDNIKVGVLGALGIGLLLYTAISLVQKIEEAFNFTWNVDRRRTLARRFSDYLSVLVIGPLLVFLALGITATLTSSTIVQYITSIEPFGYLFRLTTSMLPYVFVILAFTFLYVLIPNTRVRLGAALYGGVVAGVLWESVGKIFATFVAGSTNYTAIYSGFAILLLFMIWLYLSWLILLIGSSIAFYRQHPEYLLAGGHTGVKLSPAQGERLAVAVMLLVVGEWYREHREPDRDLIASRIEVPAQAIDRTLSALLKAGLLAPTSREVPGYVPGRPPERISVKDVLDAVRRHDHQPRVLKDRKSREAQVMDEVDDALTARLGDVTIASLALSDTMTPTRDRDLETT